MQRKRGYHPIHISEPDYIKVYTGLMDRFKTASTQYTKYTALKVLFIYIMSERFEIKPVWLDILQYKHLNLQKGIINTPEYFRELDEQAKEVMNLLVKYIPGTISSDTYIMRSQRHPNRKQTHQSLYNVLSVTLQKYNIDGMRSNLISYNRPRKRKEKIQKVYSTWEDILRHKFELAKKNIDLRLKKKEIHITNTFGWSSIDDAVKWGLKVLEENNYKCVRTGNYLTKVNNNNQVSIDRVKSHLGYTPDNVQLVTAKYNLLKMDLTDEDLFNLCTQIVREGIKTNQHVEQLIDNLDKQKQDIDVAHKNFQLQIEKIINPT